MSTNLSIKSDFTLMAILLIPIAVAINFIGGALALALRLPLYLDSIGTFLVAMLAGPWVGAVTGVVSLLSVSITDPTSMPWMITAGIMGFTVGLLARKGMFTRWGRVVVSIVIVILASVTLVVVMRYIIFGGFNTSGSSLVAAGLITAGAPFWVAQVASSVVAETPDKTLSILVALFVVRSMSDRIRHKFGKRPRPRRGPRGDEGPDLDGRTGQRRRMAADAAAEIRTTGNGLLDLNPLTQATIAGVLAISSLFFGFWWMLVVVAACIVLVTAAGRFRPFWRIWWKTIVVLSLAIIVLQTFFVPGETETFSWWLFAATEEGFASGVQIASRVLGVGSAILLLIQIVDLEKLVLDLERRGAGPKTTYVIMATANIVPQMRKQMGVIMDAQRSRGIETDANLRVRIQAFVPTIGPLILNSIAGVEEKALTLESRGFSADGPRTSLYRVADTTFDRWLRVGLVVVLAAVLAGRIVLWIR